MFGVRSGFFAVGVVVFLIAGCNGSAHQEPLVVDAASMLLELDKKFGDLERPGVLFNHGAHVKASQKEGCQACHPMDWEQRLVENKDELTDLYHADCADCHQQLIKAGKKSGPTEEACGECHLERPRPIIEFSEIRYDYSLHYQHVKAMNNKCDACHHADMENSKSACRACHGAVDQDKKLALKKASHQSCVGCHYKRLEQKQSTGPITCLGCHSKAEQQKIKKLASVPRLHSGQPSYRTLESSGNEYYKVNFNHVVHEGVTSSCSACHHQTLEACSKCHKSQPTEKDSRITLEEAYHQATSDLSCVGCHAKKTNEAACAGCHVFIQEVPGKQSCGVCHEQLEPDRTDLSLASLEANQDYFPATLVIKGLANEFMPSIFPHRKIVASIEKQVAKNKLAKRFHGDITTLCAGCHHRGSPGLRPAACGSCHNDQQHATKDKPNLYTAYHRQCIGCHQQMDVKIQGCTDCHLPASKKEEVSK
jgi:hypothetical protein